MPTETELLTLVRRAPACYSDKTDYARLIGYTGTRSVIVSDGKVVSHGNQDWFWFCNACRRARLQRQLNRLAPRGGDARQHTVWCGYGKPVQVRARHPDEACDLIGQASRSLNS